MHADEVYRQFRQMIFSVQSVSLVTCAHQEPHSLPASSCQRIGFVKSHKGTLTSNAIEQAVEVGDVVFLRPWTDTSICAHAGKQLEVFLIEFAFWTEAASSGTERTFLQGTADFPLEKSFHVRSHSQVLHLMEELHKSLDAFAHVQDAQRCELFRLHNPFADRPGKGAAGAASQPLGGSGAKRWPELVSRLSVRSDLSACLLRTWLAGWSGASTFGCFL
ncbi:hypothetical protein ABEO98_18290 [Brevibacillus parabrevis]|uniref:hypothetical protein n=1 Tax=Brevibacillus parabrevis TaxID=54914 RepID=UPI002E1C2311|nr:hypothetical protein [Brevibacillus parabrevis]